MDFDKPNIKPTKLFVSIKKRPKTTKYIVVHCSATNNLEKYNWKTIDQMHRQKGWIAIGYHFVIKTDGTIEEGRPLDSIGAHAQGFNEESVGICLIGGIDSKGNTVDNFTKAQKDSLLKLCDWLKFNVYKDVNPLVLGHRDLGANKACPCFDVIPWYNIHMKSINPSNP